MVFSLNGNGQPAPCDASMRSPCWVVRAPSQKGLSTRLRPLLSMSSWILFNNMHALARLLALARNFRRIFGSRQVVSHRGYQFRERAEALYELNRHDMHIAWLILGATDSSSCDRGESPRSTLLALYNCTEVPMLPSLSKHELQLYTERNAKAWR